MLDQVSVDIKVLGHGDVALKEGMRAMFGEAFGEPETYGRSPPCEGYLQRLLNSDTFVALAAVAEGAVVGGIAAYVLEKFKRERSEIYIYDTWRSRLLTAARASQPR